MEKEKPTKNFRKKLVKPKPKVMTLDMTEVILQGYQDDIDWAKKFKGAQVLMMSNN